MNFLEELKQNAVEIVGELYNIETEPNKIIFNITRKEFVGDYTIVVFPFVKAARKAPDKVAEEIGEAFKAKNGIVKDYNVIKGFLNLELDSNNWKTCLSELIDNDNFGTFPKKGEKVLVEFSSPNTNKPLHLGHVRNILLGWSCAQILEANGYDVVKCQIVNDRGIAVCKSMLAWSKFGKGETPETSNLKSDFLVGKYYVEFERNFQIEYSDWQKTDDATQLYGSREDQNQTETEFFKEFKNSYFNDYSILGREAKDMLLKWEDGDQKTIDLWNKMNDWVYAGHNATYNSLGVTFDLNYYESQTYLLGKENIEKGLSDGVFYKKDDGSVWIDLEDVGMDQKLVLRSDGTSVYMTQDIGTARVRYDEHGTKQMVYVVGDEQDYHFKALFEILKKLKEPFADGLFHLSYGMIDLPTGKMKGREGTIVDADNLIEEVIAEARNSSQERGEIFDLSKEEQEEITRMVGMAALKFFIIKVNPRKRMLFDPKESVDLQGQTGPYIQNAYVRIKSVLRKAEGLNADYKSYELEDQEKDLIKLLLNYPENVQNAGENYDPSGIANYCYALAKEYHRFYQSLRILKAESEEAKSFRLNLSKAVAIVLEKAMLLLGIEMPVKM
jgi:arginyl-tRNA synthetase